MCGIFGYIGNNHQATKIVLAGLKTLEYRGYDSWGIAALKQKAKSKNKKYPQQKILVKKNIGKIEGVTVSDLPGSNFVFGHTRWATHGGVTKANAHPHLDCSGTLALIHNGIIENYDEIKKELIKKGHHFISETDTEVAVHLIEENYNNLKLTAFTTSSSRLNRDKTKNDLFIEAVRVSFNRFTGLNAIVVMNTKTQSFVAAKNGSPLVLGKGKGENFLASDGHALLPYTRQVYFMEDDELVMLSSDSISVYKTATGTEKIPKFSKIDWQIKEVVKGKFSHFMLKEIFDQPQVIENIASSNKDKIEHLTDLIKKSHETYLVGCGSASYACLAGTYIFSKIAKQHINWAVASEFGYTANFLTADSLVIALSQSGETIDLIETVKKAKEKRARIAALVNVLGSSLYRLTPDKLLLTAGTEKAVVSTKAFTAKLAYLMMLAYAFKGDLESGRKKLNQAVLAIKDVLSEKNLAKIKKLVNYLHHHPHIYVIGRGLSYPIALETALKIKEASYIHAEGFPAGELKHGVIALIDKGVPCLAFLPNDETYSATLAGCMEIKARGGYIVGISYKNQEIFDYYLPVADCQLASIIPMVIIGQLIGYYLAVKCGLDPDKPRNLAKSVTVK